ncbi:amidohydrolase [Bacteroidota bacterium]
MTKKGYILAIVYILAISITFSQKNISKKKQEVINSVEKHSQELIYLSDQIWAFAETALREYKSSKVLSDYAEEQGFSVKRGIAGMPTAFIAEYGSGKPLIGILGEYDALPGLSQKAIAEKEAVVDGAAGHGCGHNLFGAASLGSALAIKELMEQGKLNGTVRFYGTPAEEAVGGKIYMAREGLFNDLDVCLDWHPDLKIKANTQSSQALIDFTVEFYGKTAHAALDPWNGRSATDGMELFLHGVNMLREHVRPSVRMHYAIQKAGDVPNVVPEYARVWMWIRDSKQDGINEVFSRVQDIAKGAQLMAGVESSVSQPSGMHELLVNRTGAKALQKNLELLGPIQYSETEIEFAKTIQQNADVEPSGINGMIHPLEETKEHPPGGSTDVGDVSWIVSVITLRTTTAPENIPWHSWAVVACGGMSIGHKGLLFSSKALAMTMVDLYENEKLIAEIKNEFIEKKGDKVYKTTLPDGPPPIPESDSGTN